MSKNKKGIEGWEKEIVRVLTDVGIWHECQHNPKCEGEHYVDPIKTREKIMKLFLTQREEILKEIGEALPKERKWEPYEGNESEIYNQALQEIESLISKLK